MLLPLLFSLIGLSLAGPFTSCPGGYKNGEKIREGSFVKQCTLTPTSYAIDVVGCLTTKGTEIPIGTKKEENKQVFNCIATDGGGARIETGPAVSSPSSPSNGGVKENMKCDGKYSNGQKFNEGAFVKQCNSSPYSAAIVIAACLSPSGKEIAIGSKVEEGRLVYSCVKTANGAKIETGPSNGGSTGPKENIKCSDKYTNGQRFNENSFVKLCTSTPSSWAISIVGCITPLGKEIAVGSKTEEGKLVYSCVKTGNGASIETDLAKKGCEDGKYQKGQTYLDAKKRFLLKCVDDYGSNDILACVTEDGKEVKVGAELTQGDFKYRCVKESNGSVRFFKEPVGGKKPVEKGCGQYAIGDEILSEDKKFKFTCVAVGEVKFTSCVVEGGEVKANTKQRIGDWNYECNATSNGGGSLSKKRDPSTY